MAVRVFLGVAMTVVASPVAAAGACSVLVPSDAQLEQSDGVLRCDPGFVCESAACDEWVKVEKGVVQVLYRTGNNRSAVVEVRDELFLPDLNATGSLSAAVRNLLAALRGGPETEAPAGRFAVRPGSVGDGAPAGTVATDADGGLTFFVADTAPGAVYVLHPQDAPSSAVRVTSDSAGVFRILPGTLVAGVRYRGGLEGAPMIAFQVAAEDRAARVGAELAANAEQTAATEVYRRALIFFDNGLAWNARRELAQLQETAAE